MGSLLTQFKEKKLLTIDEVLKDIGKKTKSIRKAKKMTIQDLSDYVNASETAIKNFEKGKSITTNNMVKILRGLNLLNLLQRVFTDETKTVSSLQDEWNKKYLDD